jgi:hypothetical protein
MPICVSQDNSAKAKCFLNNFWCSGLLYLAGQEVWLLISDDTAAVAFSSTGCGTRSVAFVRLDVNGSLFFEKMSQLGV